MTNAGYRSDTGFHPGERAVQEQAGVRAMADRVGPSVHSEMPAAARDFMARQPMVVIGHADATGRLWASALTGEPGFASALDHATVALNALPPAGGPLREVWSEGTEVGLLAIELSTRRRMRVNGRLVKGHDGGVTVAVRQAYANCPKYIQAREWGYAPDTPPTVQPRRGVRLTEVQREWIAHADTFFIATAHPEAGADASHRGGASGFVRVMDGTTLRFPDYSGNNMFNTLGNLAVNSKAGLLFLDFGSGDTLQITGEARVLWDADQAAEFAGAQRVVEFKVTEVLQTPQALPLRWRFLEASPFNP
jgi:predicted pyridoxine 5'-phosphate oxidase superfamily flavin-nucleotide-binding protein